MAHAARAALERVAAAAASRRPRIRLAADCEIARSDCHAGANSLGRHRREQPHGSRSSQPVECRATGRAQLATIARLPDPARTLQAFDTPEAQALYAWCREFERRCDPLDAIDEARLARWASDSGLIPAERVAFAGFDAMPPAMTRLLERWRAQERVVDIAGSGATRSSSRSSQPTTRLRSWTSRRSGRAIACWQGRATSA